MYVAFSDLLQVLNTGLDFWAQVWKRVWKMTVFGLTELGVGEPGITPRPWISRRAPPPGGEGGKGWRWAVFFVLNSIFFPKNLISWCQFKIIRQLIYMRKKKLKPAQKYFRIIFLNKVRVTNTQRLTYSQILVEYSPSLHKARAWSFLLRLQEFRPDDKIPRRPPSSLSSSSRAYNKLLTVEICSQYNMKNFDLLDQGQWRHDLVFTTRGSKLGDPVCSCSFSVQEALTGEQALIRFLVWKGY